MSAHAIAANSQYIFFSGREKPEAIGMDSPKNSSLVNEGGEFEIYMMERDNAEWYYNVSNGAFNDPKAILPYRD